ncbi:MAG: hypothetical protein VX898_03310 [Candidatus Thermoplasmatota archaeon]|nr:hypothetical protein [Candidatus Thermoplasmatota archaeon]
MIDKNTEQYKQFGKLWSGDTPKGINISKRNLFRSRMKNSCQQEGIEFSKINAFRIFSGEIKALESDTTKIGEIKVTKPPRRHLRGI